MKKINIFYWIFTGLYAAFIILSSIPGIMSAPDSIKLVVTQLGYPAYFVPYISVLKCLGGIVLLIPGFPRLKEWAYAGLAFDLISAIYSFIATGLAMKEWLPVFLFLIVLACSYIFYHKKLNAISPGIK
ncbi:MAG: DoxX family protein [Bacteroidota bacterium]